VSVHGANRLGCNSLLDLVVFGRRAGKAMARWIKEAPHLPLNENGGEPQRLRRLRQAHGPERVARIREQLQGLLMDRCSVFREARALSLAREGILELQERMGRVGLQGGSRLFDLELLEALELEHMLLLARVLVESAMGREESRGAHFREDFPQRDDDRFLKHSLAFLEEERIRLDWKPVSITRFPPMERRY